MLVSIGTQNITKLNYQPCMWFIRSNTARHKPGGGEWRDGLGPDVPILYHCDGISRFLSKNYELILSSYLCQIHWIVE